MFLCESLCEAEEGDKLPGDEVPAASLNINRDTNHTHQTLSRVLIDTHVDMSDSFI